MSENFKYDNGLCHIFLNSSLLVCLRLSVILKEIMIIDFASLVKILELLKYLVRYRDDETTKILGQVPRRGDIKILGQVPGR